MGKSKTALSDNDSIKNDDHKVHHKKSKNKRGTAEDGKKRSSKSHQTSSKVENDQSSAYVKSSSSKQNSNAKPETNNALMPNARILESSLMMNKQQPYFYYQNHTDSQPRHFYLHPHPIANHHDNPSLYSNYGTTLTIIIVLHILYFFQWNTRRSRQDVCTSYDQLVVKKQFYRAVVAIASHPPADGGERDINNLGSNSSHHGVMMEGGGMDNGDGPIERSGFFGRYTNCRLLNRMSSIFQRIRPLYHLIRQRILYPLMYGSLSGLPLLMFGSHILWQCRALEELYDNYDGKLILGVTADNVNMTQFAGIGTAATKIQTAGDVRNINKHLSSLNDDGYAYSRVLVALAFTSVVVELSLSRSILKRIDQVVDFDGYRTTPRQLLSQRAMCSIASLSTALLGVYDSHFPYAPPPVLPFVRVSFLSSSGFSLIFSIMILAVLTHRIHPVTSIISGLLSGSLWTLGLTSFLGTRYWGNVLLFSLALAMLLSLKAEPSYSKYLEMLVPCIDYVAWDGDGEFPGGTASSNISNALRPNTAARGRLSRNTSSNGDLEMGTRFQTQNGGHTSEERFPLLSSQSSSMSGGGSSSVIRGRVPLINTMESDLDDAGDLVRTDEESMPAASSPRFGAASLSRRGGGSGIQ